MTIRSFLAALTLGAASLGAQAHDYQLGTLAIHHPYARATVPAQSTGGAYLSIENKGPDDRLLSVSADVSKQVELHTSQMQGEVMHMREVTSIALPSHQMVRLQPNGTHIMLVGLKAPLKDGDSFPMTLKFEKAGELTVQVKVQAVGAGMPAHMH